MTDRHRLPGTILRFDPDLKARAVRKATGPDGPGSLNALVTQLLAGYVADPTTSTDPEDPRA